MESIKVTWGRPKVEQQQQHVSTYAGLLGGHVNVLADT